MTIFRNIKLDKLLSVTRIRLSLEMHTTNRSQSIKRRYLPGISILFLVFATLQIYHVVIVVVIDFFYSFFHGFTDFWMLEGTIEISYL